MNTSLHTATQLNTPTTPTATTTPPTHSCSRAVGELTAVPRCTTDGLHGHLVINDFGQTKVSCKRERKNIKILKHWNIRTLELGMLIDLGIRGYSPRSLSLKNKHNLLMMKTAPEVFMWLHMEHPAATNATMSPYLAICPYMDSQNNVLHIRHQCSSLPLYVSLILPEPSRRTSSFCTRACRKAINSKENPRRKRGWCKKAKCCDLFSKYNPLWAKIKVSKQNPGYLVCHVKLIDRKVN